MKNNLLFSQTTALGKTLGKRLVMVLTMLLIVGIGQAWGAEATVSWTATSGALGNGIGTGNIKTGSYSWNYTRTLMSGSSYTAWSSNCIQLGKNGGVENITFTTSAIPGTIKTVSIECASYQGKHNVAITVGGKSYLSSTATSSWTTVSAKSGSGTSSGTIQISLTGGTRALYIKSISVTYEENSGGGEPTPEPDDDTEDACGWIETDISNISSTDDVVITMTNGTTTWALTNGNGTSNAPEATVLTLNIDGSISENPNQISDAILWNISNNETLTIFPKGSSTTWLYCTNTNDGVRVGTNENQTFTIVNGIDTDAENYFLQHTATNRYVGVFTTNPDWRCYTLTKQGAFPTNLRGQTLKFYKYVECGSTEPTVYLIPKCGCDGGTWLVVIEWFTTF